MGLAIGSGETGERSGPQLAKPQLSDLLRAADRARDERQWPEAALLYREVLDLDPARAPIWVQYGHMLKESGRTDEAGKAYEKALALDGANADTHLQFGHLLKITDKRLAAIQMYARALQLDPALQDARVELERLDAKPIADSILEGKAPASLYCQWLWHAITVLCDGTVTCGLDDPFKRRNYGSLKSASLQDIFARPAVKERRQRLMAGTRCQDCGMYTIAAGKSADTLTPDARYPGKLILEPSIKCNIRCNNETCNIANDAAFHIRREDFMPWPLYTKLMDEVAPHLKDLYFYNYGEPFVHPKALDMLAYAKTLNPKLKVTTSTNGILLARDGMAERIVEENLVDWICFTIGGVNQETYVRYHKAGSFEKAMLGMRRLMEAKRRAAKPLPIVHWRYLLFNWNDSDECIAEALRLREEIGVDQFKFMLTASPMDGRSLLRAPGTPGFKAIEPWLAYQDFYCPDAFVEAGLWPEEKHPKLGVFRWTGRTARVLMKPADGKLNVRLAKTGNPLAPVQQATIRLPWGEFPATLGMGAWGENSIDVPEAFAGSDVEIGLELNEVFSPLRHSDSHDNRELGVMISMEGVAPAPNPHRPAPIEAVRITDRSR
jgi:tetratricopeptide (TPR) repeat protein